jgi:hypothetical protein
MWPGSIVSCIACLHSGQSHKTVRCPAADSSPAVATAIDVRDRTSKIEIEDNGVGPAPIHFTQRGDAIWRELHIESRQHERSPQVLAHRRIVLDDEDERTPR